MPRLARSQDEHDAPRSQSPLRTNQGIGNTVLGRSYRRYVLWTLTIVYTLNFLDRGLIGLLLQPIKEDLHLSDTQLGLLTGIAFGLFYATVGLPLARWADRGNRVTITSISIGLWGATVMMCVFVTNFMQLVCARVCAAIGEAGCMPPTYSLLGDYYPAPAERARAMAVYMLGGPLSSLVSFSAGGWLNSHYGWRMTFFVMGAPALIMALVVKATIREPRLQSNQSYVRTEPLPRLARVLATLWKQNSSRHLIVAITLLFTLGCGMAPWYAAFMMRSHGMSTAELGIWLGLIFGVGGVSGTFLGGYVAARWFANNEGKQMRMSAWMTASLVPCYALFLLLPEKQHALVSLMLLVTVFSIFVAPTFALMQRLVVDEMRATTLAVVMLVANLIGMGAGPQMVGILSDGLAAGFGVDSLRYAMLIMSFVAAWSAYHFWRVGQTAQQDLLSVAAWSSSSGSLTLRESALPTRT
jgi:predicted MFS family arabinose efflux permease